MSKPGHTGAKRLAHATRNSLRGLGHAWRHESAFRQETATALVLTPVAILLGEDALQRLLLIGSCLVVLIVELLNSAVEATVDRIGPERHELSGRAKDLASAAVMLSLILFAAAWGSVLSLRLFA